MSCTLHLCVCVSKFPSEKPFHFSPKSFLQQCFLAQIQRWWVSLAFICLKVSILPSSPSGVFIQLGFSMDSSLPLPCMVEVLFECIPEEMAVIFLYFSTYNVSFYSRCLVASLSNVSDLCHFSSLWITYLNMSCKAGPLTKKLPQFLF